MRKLLHTGLGLVLLLLVVGCGRKTVPVTTTIVHDSVSVKETPRYVEVFIPGDTVEIKTFIECDSITNKPKPFQIKKKSGKTTLTVQVKPTGELVATSESDSLKKVIQALDREIFRLRQESKTETVVVTDCEPKWYDMAARWVAVIAVLILVGYALAKYNKII